MLLPVEEDDGDSSVGPFDAHELEVGVLLLLDVDAEGALGHVAADMAQRVEHRLLQERVLLGEYDDRSVHRVLSPVRTALIQVKLDTMQSTFRMATAHAAKGNSR